MLLLLLLLLGKRKQRDLLPALSPSPSDLYVKTHSGLYDIISFSPFSTKNLCKLEALQPLLPHLLLLPLLLLDI